MINFAGVNIDSLNFGDSDIMDRLRVLYTTAAGTVPLDRSFGIDTSIVDLPLPQAMTRLVVEYRDKTRQYESGVIVEEVSFDEADPLSGQLIPKVVVSRDD